MYKIMCYEWLGNKAKEESVVSVCQSFIKITLQISKLNSNARSEQNLFSKRI